MPYVIEIRNPIEIRENVVGQKIYENIKHAVKVLETALDFEEKYDFLLSNFIEYENDCLKIAVDEMVKCNFNYDYFYEIRSILNRRIINFLTTARLYIDQLKSKLKIFKSDVKNQFDKYLSDNYGDKFEYRFMEALRNYVQHCGKPVHEIIQNSEWNATKGDNQLRYITEVYSRKKVLLEDQNFKKRVLNEMPEKVNLTAAIRVYIELINNVHTKTRKLILPSIEEAKKIFESELTKHKIEFDDKNNDYEIKLIDSDNKEHSFTLSWESIRSKLQYRNCITTNISKSYVTNKT